MVHGDDDVTAAGVDPSSVTWTSFRAVRETATSFHMDWPVHQPDDPGTAGATVFILDENERRISDVAAPDLTDEAADAALDRIGWSRRGPWQPDVFGRPTARVVATAAREPIPLPRQRTPTLVDEATLHHA